MLDHIGHHVDQVRQPAASGHLLLRPPQLAPQEATNGEMTIGAERAVDADLPNQHRGLGFEPPQFGLDLVQP